MMTYEKPKMQFTSLQATHAVANSCWPAPTNSNPVFYYNTSGVGYAQINFTSVYTDGSNGNTCKQGSSYTITYRFIDQQNMDQAISEATQAADDVNKHPNPFHSDKFNLYDTPQIGWSK